MKLIINRISFIDSIFLLWYNVYRKKVYMFCINCGNKLEENACVCLNCGVLVKKRSESKVIKQRKKNSTNNKVLGIISIVFGSLALIFSLMLYFHDISSVGMYTEIGERVLFVLDYAITALLMSSITLVLSFVSKINNYTKISLLLSLLSFFFIIIEFIVVIIY